MFTEQMAEHYITHMPKQKTSYTITDVADQQLAELAENNGLNKSSLVEMLIRQAHAVGWTVAKPLVSQPTQGQMLPYADQEPLVIDLWAMRNTKPTNNRLANAIVVAVESTDWTPKDVTWQEVARIGEARFREARNVGGKTINELKAILIEKGCPLLP